MNLEFLSNLPNMMDQTGITLAWIPLFDPINFFQDWWFLLAVPMAFLVSMIYKAMRVRLLYIYWRQVIFLTIQILMGMTGLMLSLYVLIEWVVPMLPVE